MRASQFYFSFVNFTQLQVTFWKVLDGRANIATVLIETLSEIYRQYKPQLISLHRPF